MQDQPALPGSTVEQTQTAPVIPEIKPTPIQALVAPPPQVERYPIVIGSSLSTQYITSTYRLATQGWRWQFVDVINELFEHDPHARGVTRQRLLPLAGARVVVMPAKLPESASQSDKDQAKKIADEVQRQFDTLPMRAQALGKLAWGIVYGLSGAETLWDRSQEPGVKWEVIGLQFIHSRRLNLPDPNSWDVYIYDQGPVNPWSGQNLSLGYGLRVADYPGKFIVHAPALNGDYSTRDGEARYVGVYMALKRMIVRCTAQDFERTIRPWVVGYFNREKKAEDSTVAGPEDIARLSEVVEALGLGSLNSGVLPDACKVEILRAASTLSAKEFAEWLDQQVTLSMLGQTYTTAPSQRGTHEAASVADANTIKINRYDAQCLADTLERDLVRWMVELNWPGSSRRLMPRLQIVVEDAPNPKLFGDLVKLATSVDIPVDVDEAGERMGLPVVKAEDMDKARRTRVVATTKESPIEPSGDDPNDPNTPKPNPNAGGDEGDDEGGGKGGSPKPKAKNGKPEGDQTPAAT